MAGCGEFNLRHSQIEADFLTDIRARLCEINHGCVQVYPTGIHELQKEINSWLEYISHAHGLCRRYHKPHTAYDRLDTPRELGRCYRQSGEIRAEQYHNHL